MLDAKHAITGARTTGLEDGHWELMNNEPVEITRGRLLFWKLRNSLNEGELIFRSDLDSASELQTDVSQFWDSSGMRI